MSKAVIIAVNDQRARKVTLTRDQYLRCREILRKQLDKLERAAALACNKRELDTSNIAELAAQSKRLECERMRDLVRRFEGR